jgi:hypothetical protein
MEKRELSTLSLAPLYKNRLHVAGFRTVQDLISVDAEILSKGDFFFFIQKFNLMKKAATVLV